MIAPLMLSRLAGGAITGRDFLNLACFDFSCGMDAMGWDGMAERYLFVHTLFFSSERAGGNVSSQGVVVGEKVLQCMQSIHAFTLLCLLCLHVFRGRAHHVSDAVNFSEKIIGGKECKKVQHLLIKAVRALQLALAVFF
jgi:hypothetical protein